MAGGQADGNCWVLFSESTLKNGAPSSRLLRARDQEAAICIPVLRNSMESAQGTKTPESKPQRITQPLVRAVKFCLGQRHLRITTSGPSPRRSTRNLATTKFTYQGVRFQYQGEQQNSRGGDTKARNSWLSPVIFLVLQLI